MDPVSISFDPMQVAGMIGAFVAGWFLGGWYKSRRTGGATREEVIAEGKAVTVAHLRALADLLRQEVGDLKAKIDAMKQGK